MDKHGIGEHVRWETEVLGAAWDDATATWTVASAGPTGRGRRCRPAP